MSAGVQEDDEGHPEERVSAARGRAGGGARGRTRGGVVGHGGACSLRSGAGGWRRAVGRRRRTARRGRCPSRAPRNWLGGRICWSRRAQVAVLVLLARQGLSQRSLPRSTSLARCRRRLALRATTRTHGRRPRAFQYHTCNDVPDLLAATVPSTACRRAAARARSELSMKARRRRGSPLSLAGAALGQVGSQSKLATSPSALTVQLGAVDPLARGDTGISLILRSPTSTRQPAQAHRAPAQPARHRSTTRHHRSPQPCSLQRCAPSPLALIGARRTS